jgi:hypothetical protein
MKQFLIFSLVLFGINSNVFSQRFTGSITASYGYLNEKVRLQYEHPLNNQLTVGGNINYYLVNWKGPLFEPFFRFYGKSGNEEGYFGQVKVGYGNLSTVYAANEAQYVVNKRMNTFGVGIGYGYKYLFDDRFVVESYLGLRYYTYTPTRYTDNYYLLDVEPVKNLVWFLTTGLPIEANIKVGYQF